MKDWSLKNFNTQFPKRIDREENKKKDYTGVHGFSLSAFAPSVVEQPGLPDIRLWMT